MKRDEILSLTGESDVGCPGRLSRRTFMGLAAAGAAGAALAPRLAGQDAASTGPPVIKTNIEEAMKIPRGAGAMPGRYPGRVVALKPGAMSEAGEIDADKVQRAVDRGMAALTGEEDMGKAWAQFVTPEDVVGIKVNPIGGNLLSTRPEVVDAIVEGLRAAGVPDANIVIWDRRLFQMHEAGFTEERFPGIRLLGTEMRGPNGEFYDDEGRLWARDNIDREVLPYVADLEMEYNRETLPYMINMGKESYFTKIATQTCTKIINVPVLKNAGPTVTLCLKNLSYGALSNTSRLHKIWSESVAQPSAFPCLRDKTVLNIVDGLKACYDGGPGANPKFIYTADLMYFGTDPVAVDAVGHEYITKERIARGVQEFEDKRRRAFLEIASELGLGVADRGKIDLVEIKEG